MNQPINIIAARIDWMDGRANDPHLTVVADRDPVFVYDVKVINSWGHMLFLAVDDPFVSMILWNGDINGFAGRSFSLPLKDGTTYTNVGFWDVSTGYALKHFDVQCINAGYGTDLGVIASVIGRSASAVSILSHRYAEIANRFHPDLIEGSYVAMAGMASTEQAAIIGGSAAPSIRISKAGRVLVPRESKPAWVSSRHVDEWSFWFSSYELNGALREIEADHKCRIKAYEKRMAEITREYDDDYDDDYNYDGDGIPF